MRRLENFLLFLISVPTFLIFLLLFFNLSLVPTLFSPSFFSKIYDASDFSQVLISFAAEEAAALGQGEENNRDQNPENAGDGPPPDLGQMVMTHLDQGWVNQEVPKLIKGVDSYLMGREENLPIVNIAPLKKGLLEGLADEQMKRPDFKETLALLQTLTNLIDTKLKKDFAEGNDQALVQKLKSEKPVRAVNASDDLLMDIISAHRFTKNTEDLARQVVISQFSKEMKLGTIQDNLDLNLLLKTIYRGKPNPLALFRNAVSGLRKYTFAVLVIILAALMGLTFVVALNQKRFIRWTGGSLATSGATAALIGILGMTLPLVQRVPEQAVSTMKNDNDAAVIAGLGKMMHYAINGYLRWLIIFGFVTFALVLGGFFLNKLLRRRTGKAGVVITDVDPSPGENPSQLSSPRARTLLFLGRGLTFVLLLAAIWQAAMWGTQGVESEVKVIQESVGPPPSVSGDINIVDAIAQASVGKVESK